MEPEPIDITPVPPPAQPGPDRRRAVLGWTVALVAAFALGFTAAKATPPTQSEAALPDGCCLSAPGPQCAVQDGQRLQLGVEFRNVGQSRLYIDRVQVTMPLGGLRLTGVAWGACGQLHPEFMADPEYEIPASGSQWVVAAFDVLVECPAPYPVEFQLFVTGSGQAWTITGFRDLGDVAYTGCA